MSRLNLFTTKRFFFRLLRHIPMPLLAILIGLMAGLAVWGVLDHVQSRAVTKIFRKELKVQLDLRSRESLIRFDQFVANYAATARLLANHRRLAEYLEPLFWLPDEEVNPVVYEGFLDFYHSATGYSDKCTGFSCDVQIRRKRTIIFFYIF